MSRQTARQDSPGNEALNRRGVPMPVIAAAVALFLGIPADGAEPAGRLRFNRDVRPILADKCFRCHGPDRAARKGDLRLDRREEAIAAKAIVPRDLLSSLIHRRTTATDESMMPPRESGLSLSPREIRVLSQWIDEGAEYEPHWSFVVPTSVRVPEAGDSVKNPVDRFVEGSLASRGLRLSPATEPATLLRRVSLALTGLPPTPQELDHFLSDQRPEAYDRAVDRLLASPRYGERMASVWLDAARYADTNGYFGDNPRQIWPWRDWVIRAFNDNRPFDQFTIEQLAGDLLPGATLDQKVATGFNRNHTVTDETGVIDEEYRVEYVADRLETTASVWLGLTVGCARCHDHKYDPIPQRDYYRLFAFFNNGPETGLAVAHDPPPTLDLTTPSQQETLERLRAKRTEADSALDRVVQSLREPMAVWERTAPDELVAPESGLSAHVSFDPEEPNANARGEGATPQGGEPTLEAGILGRAALLDGMRSFEAPRGILSDLDQPWTLGLWIKPTGSLNCVLSKVDPAHDRRGLELLWAKGRLKLHLIHRWGVDAIEVATENAVAKAGWHHVVVRADGSRKAAGVQIFVDGRSVPLKIEKDSLRGSSDNAMPLLLGRRDNGLGYYGHLDELRTFDRALGDDEIRRWHWSDRIRGILAVDPTKRDAVGQTALRDYYIEHLADEAARGALRESTEARRAEEACRAALPKTLVMQEQPKPRVTHLLKRGQYDHPGEETPAGFPEAIPLASSFGEASAPLNRLDLARWIVSPQNPLTARVAVNRLWQIAFGEGLVRTPNDFGSQGESPTHPELLDWLAVRFIESGWDVKEMLRLIVTSATYRQSSVPGPALLANDPENRWLARGPRFRLPAEILRDQSLAISGLLVERLGGPSVKPWQPAGLWEAVSYDGDATYVPDRGEGQWRRSLYSYWKRQSPPPLLLIFDAPTRETCSVQRPRTNTPSQALVLLNDPTFVHAARTFATGLLATNSPRDSGSLDSVRIRLAFRTATCRDPDDRELRVLLQLLERQRRRFRDSPDVAAELARFDGEKMRSAPAISDEELAAWTALVQVILNLDETLTSR